MNTSSAPSSPILITFFNMHSFIKTKCRLYVQLCSRFVYIVHIFPFLIFSTVHVFNILLKTFFLIYICNSEIQKQPSIMMTVFHYFHFQILIIYCMIQQISPTFSKLLSLFKINLQIWMPVDHILSFSVPNLN